MIKALDADPFSVIGDNSSLAPLVAEYFLSPLLAVCLLWLTFGAPNESLAQEKGTAVQPAPLWFTGTIFDYDPKLGAIQCVADPANCGTAGRGLETLIADCGKEYTECLAGRWHNPNWHPERAAFSPDGSHLLVTVCRNLDRQRCTLRRYWIEESRWDDLPGLDPSRYYGWGVYDPTGGRIAAASWKCIDLPRRTDDRSVSQNEPVTADCGIAGPGLWLLDVNGKPIRPLLAGQATGQSITQDGQHESQPLAGPMVRSPMFSPDGKRLAYWRMIRGVAWGKNNFSPWSVFQVDLETGSETRIDTGFWDIVEGSPIYIEQGKRLVFSAHAFTPRFQDYGEVFVVDLAGALPVATPPHYLDNKVSGTVKRMALRDMTADGSLALVATVGGGRARMGSLYLVDPRRGGRIFDGEAGGVLRKIWQEAATAVVNHDAAFARNSRKIALISASENIQWSGHGTKQLWLLDDNGQPRHIRLNW
jgi:hypothetical protein